MLESIFENNKKSVKERISQLALGSSIGIIGLLDKQYNGIAEQFVHNYGSDILGPFACYNISRGAGFKQFSALTFSFLYCSICEILQGLSITQGTFDSKDFLAYASGTMTAYCLEKGITKLYNIRKIKRHRPNLISIFK